jgi:hypothetical protein
MAEHGLSGITVEHLRERMSSRFVHLHYNDQYHGSHAGEYAFLETMLSDDVIADEGSSDSTMEGAEQLQKDSAPVVIAHGVRQKTIGERGVSRVVGGSASPPELLTGGIPSTESLQTPMLPLTAVPEFSHGGYDGGIEIGFDGTWNPLKFPRLLEILEEGKENAS